MNKVARYDLSDFLDRDLAANGLRVWHWSSRFKYDVLHFLRVLRKTEFAAAHAQGPFATMRFLLLRLRLKRLGRRLGLDLPLHVIGPGLVVVHPVGIVVSSKARIGSNCRMHAGVNVGEHRGKAPVIGDYVYLGPGAKVVGGVAIGDRSVVGANAVVVKDVPPGVTVGGVPARILSNRDSSDMISTAGGESIGRP